MSLFYISLWLTFKKNIIEKLQKLYSLPINLRAGNKLPMLFLKKPLYCPHAKYSLKGLPLTKFTSNSGSTEFKDILPRNISQMITKTVPTSRRIVITYAMKRGILLWIWWKVHGNRDNNMQSSPFNVCDYTYTCQHMHH